MSVKARVPDTANNITAKNRQPDIVIISCFYFLLDSLANGLIGYSQGRLGKTRKPGRYDRELSNNLKRRGKIVWTKNTTPEMSCCLFTIVTQG